MHHTFVSVGHELGDVWPLTAKQYLQSCQICRFLAFHFEFIYQNLVLNLENNKINKGNKTGTWHPQNAVFGDIHYHWLLELSQMSQFSPYLRLVAV